MGLTERPRHIIISGSSPSGAATYSCGMAMDRLMWLPWVEGIRCTCGIFGVRICLIKERKRGNNSFVSFQTSFYT